MRNCVLGRGARLFIAEKNALGCGRKALLPQVCTQCIDKLTQMCLLLSARAAAGLAQGFSRWAITEHIKFMRADPSRARSCASDRRRNCDNKRCVNALERVLKYRLIERTRSVLHSVPGCWRVSNPIPVRDYTRRSDILFILDQRAATSMQCQYQRFAQK